LNVHVTPPVAVASDIDGSSDKGGSWPWNDGDMKLS
jgi:hypothetical protein